jgi:hypothetical protein
VIPLVLTQVTQIVVLIFGFSTSNKRFDDVNRRFDEMERRFDKIDRRLESIEAKIDGHGERSTRLEERTGPITRGR